MAARAKIEKPSNDLLLSQCMDFKIIIKEFSLGDCLQKFLKPFCFIEQNGHQGYK